MRLLRLICVLLLVACGSEPASTNEPRGPIASGVAAGAAPLASTAATVAPTSQPTPSPARATSTPAPTTTPPGFVGTWRVYSERLFYDVGGAGSLITTNFQTLTLGADSSWRYSSSSGRFSVSPIVASDWTRWGSNPYGPTMKITLAGWNGSSADGPVEESTRVDFVWVIYRVGPPDVSAPGSVHMKFGH